MTVPQVCVLVTFAERRPCHLKSIFLFVLKKFPIALKENLQEEEDISTRAKWLILSVFFVRRFYCIYTLYIVYTNVYCCQNFRGESVWSPALLELAFYCMCYTEHCTCVLQDFIYPENVAYPIGGPGSARYLVMEMHYDNPNMTSGMLDFYDLLFVRLSD